MRSIWGINNEKISFECSIPKTTFSLFYLLFSFNTVSHYHLSAFDHSKYCLQVRKDKYWFLTMIYIGGGIPMNTWLMKGYFDTVPIDLDESAKLDGAGHFRIFFQIVLPLVKPMLAVQALWAFMGPFGDFMLAKFLLRTPENQTVAVGLQTFISDVTNQRVSLFAAGAILIALPICLLFFFLQKNFVTGLTSGGTKG
ncbi:sugar ABC transporter permease [Enterococcus faecium]|uniref:sugar ABC transporter permease n=1 Tax=Enterococcus faecium TaxID=1352 RepID=UPI00336558DA